MFTIPIVPQNLLHHTNAKGGLVLAHLIGKTGYEEYTNYYKDFTHYKILDNGVYEEEGITDIKELLRLALFINADEVALPDVYKDGYATIKSVYKSYDTLVDKYAHLTMSFMAIPQGKDLNEFLTCAKELCKLPLVKTIGVPKHLVDTFGMRDARLVAIDEMADAGILEGKQIHLLGCWKTPLEVLTIAVAARDKKIPDVRSCDSAIPYIYARNKMGMSDDDRPDFAPVSFREDNMDAVQLAFLERNLDAWERLPAIVAAKNHMIW